MEPPRECDLLPLLSASSGGLPARRIDGCLESCLLDPAGSCWSERNLRGLVLGSPALRQVGSNLARPWVNLPPRDISPIRSALIVSQSILGLGSGLAPSRKGASLGSAHPHLAAEEVAAVIPGGSVGLDRIIPPCPARWRASHIPAGPACLPTHGPAEMQEIL